MNVTTLHLRHPVLVERDRPTVLAWHAAMNLVEGSWDSSNPSRIVVPGGCSRVQLRSGICFEPDASGLRQIWSRTNGSEVRGEGYPVGYMSSTHGPGVEDSSVSFTAQSAIMPAAEGDIFELLAYQTSGRALWVGGVPEDAASPEGTRAFGCVYFEAAFLT